MSTGTVVRVMHGAAVESGVREIEVLGDESLKARYDRLAALILRMGGWLTGPRAAMLPAEEWDTLFGRYRDHLEQLREMGDRLRPVTLRERHEPLVGDALVNDVLELFAA